MSEGELKQELLSDLGAMIAREVELDELLKTFGLRVAEALGADRATLWLVDARTGELRSRVANLLELDELRMPIGRGVAGYVAQRAEVVNIRDAASDQRWAPEIDQRTGYRTRSMLCVPVVEPGDRGAAPDRLRGVVQVLNKDEGAFTQADERFLRELAQQITRALAYTSLRAGHGVERGVSMRGRFNHIIGDSPAMEAVYDRILRAARTDATVLLHGETGTGKGLMARAIHVNSKRSAGPLIHVDCTTLPANLVESELFGHERGAYTGADSRVPGKVELADGGTLFLDEIGELPLPLQGKLLRFLQERQFERVGGRRTQEADVRVVAATNRPLAQMVRAGDFRSDLYYRVRVVDIQLPSLRARGGSDIAALAEHFVGVYGRRYEKRGARLSAEAMRALVHHSWPGNVRELEHAIERAVVLCADECIDAAALGLVGGLSSGGGAGGAVAEFEGDAASAPAAATATGAGAHAQPGAQPDAAATAGEGGGVWIPGDLGLDDASRVYATAILERAGGNRSEAARQLGIGRNRLARLLRD
ncbi:sigma-54-dependent Fis family transcriptional regulator [Haliangium ochraceum]|uniref:sigma-54-dependent Fis family transcriptional regulator n=1 Tax=Haliangium ochraceum TaxID=80816 RepID=UPI00019BA9DF|nr:sigma-54-dependent Fis family transcriptional regulator [Haliangium ochraceum]